MLPHNDLRRTLRAALMPPRAEPIAHAEGVSGRAVQSRHYHGRSGIDSVGSAQAPQRLPVNGESTMDGKDPWKNHLLASGDAAKLLVSCLT